jgi:hypothetical protein
MNNLFELLTWILFDRLCMCEYLIFESISFFVLDFSNVKRDNRSVFLYAYENAEAFLSVELQIFFSSAERRTA